jgi:hypothetical protein
MSNFSFQPNLKTLYFLLAHMLLGVHWVVQAQVLEQKKPIPTQQRKLNWRESGNKKGLTFGEYQAAFYNDWAGRKPKKGQGFKPFKRWEDFMAPRVYPSGDMTLPATTYTNYMEWQKKYALQNSRARTSGTLSSTGNWTELGPLSKPAGYDAGVGRIDFVRFDPVDPASIMYVCSPDGGLWKTIDGGVNWTTNTDFLPIIGCADLVIDPTNTQTMYLATGNREFDRSSIGILKSIDGGTTWNPTSVVIPPEYGWTIRRLIMHPTDPQMMIAVLNAGVFRTTDGWNTYTQPAELQNVDLEDTEFKPGDPSTVYAIGKNFYKSTDNGASWSLVTSGLPDGADVTRALIAVTAADPAYVYAVYGNTDGGYLGTYRSTDSGSSFTAQSTFASLNNNILNCDTLTTTTSGQATHNLAIAVSPTNADSVSIGGCNIWQSGDGGISWTLSSYWLGFDPAYPSDGVAVPDYVHADIQSLDYLPGSSSVLFATCDGGISKSTIGGNKKWTDISNNLRVAQMTNVGQSSLTPFNMIAGLQDIGTLKNSNGTWFVTNGGDGEDGFIDRTNDNIIITSNPNGAFALSTDAGLTRDNITGLPPGTEFFSPIQQDPVDASVVYAGGRSQLFKSNTVLSDPNASWTPLGTPAGTGGITRFVIAPSNNQVIYALKYNAISKSTDGGSGFTDITGTLPTSLAQLTNLCVSNTDADKVWVTFSGYEAGEKVYKSTDGGTTWVNISTGLPNLPMNTIVHTSNSLNDALYLGADIGVYYRDDTTPWLQFSTGLPNNHVNDLEIYYPTSKIRAATYGRGLWESDLFTVCVKPDAGKDSTYACAANQLPTSFDLTDAQAGQEWQVGEVPLGASVSVTPTTGIVSGTLVVGVYQFILQTLGADSQTCRDTVQVTVVSCPPVCTPPTRLVTATDPTCTTTGTIELTSTANGDKYGLSLGSTYTGPAYSAAAAVPGSLPAIIKGSLSNAADSTFTIRIFNLANDCFKDTTVTVKAAPVKPTVTTMLPLCRANGTTYTIKFIATGGTVTTVPGFPVTGDSIADIPLATASVKLIVTSADGCKDSVTVAAPNCTAGQIVLNPSAYLQGALYGVLSPSMLMRDDLRTKGLIPTASPYPGMGMTGITTANMSSAAVVGESSPSGTDAIVDWVFIELRSALDNLTVVDSRSALIQRDGDIVDVDGISSLQFSVAPAGDYFVVVKHRNHLSVMSQTAVALSTSPLAIDFRQASTPTYNIDPLNPNNVPQVSVAQGMAMWAGNVLYANTLDGKHNVIFQGSDNDVNVIYQQIINSPANTLPLSSFKLKGYYVGDLTMDGETISQGAGNDTEFIYQNIINNHPGNITQLSYFKIKEQTK